MFLSVTYSLYLVRPGYITPPVPYPAGSHAASGSTNTRIGASSNGGGHPPIRHLSSFSRLRCILVLTSARLSPTVEGRAPTVWKSDRSNPTTHFSPSAEAVSRGVVPSVHNSSPSSWNCCSPVHQRFRPLVSSGSPLSWAPEFPGASPHSTLQALPVPFLSPCPSILSLSSHYSSFMLTLRQLPHFILPHLSFHYPYHRLCACLHPFLFVLICPPLHVSIHIKECNQRINIPMLLTLQLTLYIYIPLDLVRLIRVRRFHYYVVSRCSHNDGGDEHQLYEFPKCRQR
uniref:Uncharacterized protein n=1 Tax=Timema genevievae TaxID=629358 RepID=A0A7R9JRJ5_TIMGE|nr:unnamed protein product [Timema genevievae]